ncbi:LEM3 (ligand-effect modulator 3) family protein / CDC50 family protein isoform 1 [Hibiscus syriacus]|uniref:LEM3 (Ligand-effect modulator 3) family protein / CDC50 family protein isoform 1 n=1 Tax=Hibiscus syriacus TaxID=106335 RepID=A0A6A3BDZ5_HIBSY|nr:LEM3 (ligand-effect modulator 3) family protein / CDC50 family protein isoform 1 [Hibiscus syriacus]
MTKEVGYKQNWGAVAPSLLINPRKSSTCPRLETILEEGYENHAVFPKKLLVVLPLVLSTAVYFLINKDFTLCA